MLKKRVAILIIAVFAVVAVAASLAYAAGAFSSSPHGNTTSGANRDATNPRGSCKQCHVIHNDPTTYDYTLFATNNISLCFSTSCHSENPPSGATSGYPAVEADRFPAGLGGNNCGYYEYNNGATKTTGTNNRVRWPGSTVYTDSGMSGGKYYSPHYNDVSMPESGHCRNCHDPHGTSNDHDMLTNTYLNAGPTTNFDLCFTSCHETGGVPSDAANRNIEGYYSVADNEAGHQFRGKPNVIASLPTHITIGDKMPCYNCHNAHGSQNNNTNLLSDQRWTGLTDTINTASENRTFCLGCHVTSDGSAGDNTLYGVNMLPLPNSLTEHDSGNATSCYFCHADGSPYATSTSRNVHHIIPGRDAGSCMGCHGTTKGGHRQIVGGGGDFDDTSHHVGDAGEVVTDDDCKKCHTQTLHPYTTDSVTITLRNADTDADITYVRGDTSQANLDNLDTFCMSCHDANGYAGDTTPFSDNQTALNVYDQFAPTNSSHHAVRGAKSPLSGTNANSFVGGWTESSTLHCSDCHTVATNAHGSNNTPGPLMQNASVGTSNYVCFLCHNYQTYDLPNVTGGAQAYSRFNHDENNKHDDDVFRGFYCLTCHAGAGLGFIHGYRVPQDYTLPTDSTPPPWQNDIRFLAGESVSHWRRVEADGRGYCATVGGACTDHNKPNKPKKYDFNY